MIIRELICKSVNLQHTIKIKLCLIMGWGSEATLQQITKTSLPGCEEMCVLG